MRARLNWQLVAWNLAEAREELQRLEAAIGSGRPPNETQMRIDLEHAYHHLNFAWNARRVGQKQRRMLSDADFRRFSRFPTDLAFVFDLAPPKTRRLKPRRRD